MAEPTREQMEAMALRLRNVYCEAISEHEVELVGFYAVAKVLLAEVEKERMLWDSNAGDIIMRRLGSLDKKVRIRELVEEARAERDSHAS